MRSDTVLYARRKNAGDSTLLKADVKEGIEAMRNDSGLQKGPNFIKVLVHRINGGCWVQQ